jgi:hypothetical protein
MVKLSFKKWVSFDLISLRVIKNMLYLISVKKNILFLIPVISPW